MKTLSAQFIDIVILYGYAITRRGLDVPIPLLCNVRIQFPDTVAKDCFCREAAERLVFVIDIEDLRVIQFAVFGVRNMIDAV